MSFNVEFVASAEWDGGSGWDPDGCGEQEIASSILGTNLVCVVAVFLVAYPH